MNRIIFSYSNSSVIFDWIVGTKTINIFSKEDSLRENAISCISFGHEKSKTIKKEAEKVIKNWRKNNNDY